MAIKKVEIQDNLGNVYYPHTDANVVFTKDGKTVEESLVNLENELGTNKATLLANIAGIREVL